VTTFQSFLFNELSKIDNLNIKCVYEKLWNIYQECGEPVDFHTFESAIRSIDNNCHHINPLVFRYFGESSNFGWHKHPGKNNRFQLLINLSRPGIDYTAGETMVWMGEGKPTFLEGTAAEAKKIDEMEIFDSRFEQGDLFSFPYTKWHRVSKLGDFEELNKEQERVSLLMPIARRIGGSENEYI